jgi:hypothetical protein
MNGKSNYGQRWYTIRNQMLLEYVEIWRTADKVELMALNDFTHRSAPNIQVFDVPLAELTKHYLTETLTNPTA